MKRKPFAILAICFGILTIVLAADVQAYEIGPYWLTLGSDQYCVVITDLPPDSGIAISEVENILSKPDWLDQFLNDGQVTFTNDAINLFTVEDPNFSPNFSGSGGTTGTFPGIGNWTANFPGSVGGTYPLIISISDQGLPGSGDPPPIPNPEPATLLLLAIGLCGLPWLRKLLPRK